MLPSPDDPRPEDFLADDATPDDVPDRSGLTAMQGLRSRYPRLFRSQQAATASADDDPPQAAPPQDAATPSDLGDADPSPLPQTPAPTTDTTPNAAADDGGVALLASIDPLAHLTPASTHGLVQYASNDRVQFDTSTSTPGKSSQDTPQAASSHGKTGAEQKSHDGSGTAQTELDTPDNERDLSRLLFSEANGRGYETMVAVGRAVRNRMLRDGKTKVSDVWGHGAFAHGTMTNDDSDNAAVDVLTSQPGDDPTGGATHFYSPNPMPLYKPPPPHVSAKVWQKQQEARYKKYDIGGGADDRVGADGRLHYRPSFANNDGFDRVDTPEGVDDGYFRFYRQEGDGPVR